MSNALKLFEIHQRSNSNFVTSLVSNKSSATCWEIVQPKPNVDGIHDKSASIDTIRWTPHHSWAVNSQVSQHSTGKEKVTILVAPEQYIKQEILNTPYQNLHTIRFIYCQEKNDKKVSKRFI